VINISTANMPAFLEQRGFKNLNQNPNPFQDALRTSDPLFDWLPKHPELMTHFNRFMAASRATRPDWFTIFPVDSILLDGAKTDDPDAVLLIDIGGGNGHGVSAFRKAFPDAPGKLILQDLPQVINNIPPGTLDAAILAQAYDFFTPQPVHGARAYYFRSVLHDWSDADCVKILKNVAQAMVKGYSNLLIAEWILPEKGMPLYPCMLDLDLMAVLDGMERTEGQWRGLLEEAGVRVVRFHKVSEEAEGLVEAELAE
jgi:hypothetical protein